ncbi:slow termination of phototransduction [Carabus blaptoides fortunei]
MEVLLDCFFDKVFSDMERSSLLARYKRRSLVDHLSTIIEGCIRGEMCDAQAASRNAVISAIRYHEKHRNENHSVCLMAGWKSDFQDQEENIHVEKLLQLKLLYNMEHQTFYIFCSDLEQSFRKMQTRLAWKVY